MVDEPAGATRPRLIPVRVPRRPDAAVLVLHGGASRGDGTAVDPRQLSVLRMIPVARRVALAGGRHLAVYRLLNALTGWGSTNTPVDDVRWALERLRETLAPGLPVGLVGHSLGGRAALLSAGEPGVRSVAAQAPWVYPTDMPEGPEPITDRRFLVVHGTADRIAAPDRSLRVARRIAEQAELTYLRVDGGTHAMLRHHREFDGNAAAFTAATLLGKVWTPPRRRGSTVVC